MNNKIGIVLPTRNRPELLDAWLDRACRMTSLPDKIMVIDDCSDAPINVDYLIKKYHTIADRLMFTRLQSNVGVARATLIGAQSILHWVGWAMFASDDDEIRPDTIRRFRAIVEEYPAIGFVVGNSKWVTPNGISWVSGKSIRSGIHPYHEFWKDGQSQQLRIPGEAVLYNLHQMDSMRLIYPHTNEGLCYDTGLTMSLAVRFGWYKSDCTAVTFNLNPTGVFASAKQQTRVRSVMALLDGFESRLNRKELRLVRESGVLGYVEPPKALIRDVYPDWITPMYRKLRAKRWRERFVRRFFPKAVQQWGAKWYT